MSDWLNTVKEFEATPPPQKTGSQTSPNPLERTIKVKPMSASPQVKKEVNKEVNKYTSKLVNDFRDPPVNKVGYYFTWKEIEKLDSLQSKLKPILRRKGIKVTKNEIVRACLAIGMKGFEDNQLESELVNLLTSK